MNTLKSVRMRLLLALVILTSCIGCDQATKTIATRTLKDTPPKTYLGGTIRLDYALNPGGFLSLGSELPHSVRRWLFVAFNSLAMLGLACYLVVKRNAPLALFVPLVFILAGGIGNLIDRVGNHGLVTDFLNLGIGSLRTGVFNVADIAVTLGAIAVACWAFQIDEAQPTDEPDCLS